MPRAAVLVLGIVVCAGWLAAAQSQKSPRSDITPTVDAVDPNVARGERLYRDGVGANDEPVPAIVQGDLRVLSTSMPCVNCHRRSGWGSSEGPLTVPPVTGATLFNPVTLGNQQMGVRTTGAGTRPAYDDRTLARALRDGIDAGGRPLSPTMPRYALGEADQRALASYLRTLSATPPPGVTDTTLHVATITSPSLDASKRRALLDVLQAFVRSKNAGTRGEVRRRDHGPWDMKARNEGYRQWVLHEWSLQGSPGDWPAQLAGHYARQPVFAVVSGVAEGDWAPVHEFCERHRVPCVLPQTAAPPVGGAMDDFYSLYFSRGLVLEAETAGHHLTSGREPAPRGGILQVLRCGSQADPAAKAFADSMGPGPIVRTRCHEPSTPMTPAAWRAILSDRPRVLVAWLGSEDLAGLGALASQAEQEVAGIAQLYLSSSLVGDDLSALAGPLSSRLFLLHSFVAPDDFRQHAWRTMTWLKVNGIDTAAPGVSVNALFAATIVADALGQPRSLASREYFIERIEHMISRSPLPSAYPALSLGPRRRFASSTCYVLKVPSGPGKPFTKVGT